MGRQLGIVITALVAFVGVMVVSAPAADAKTIGVDQWAKGFCNAVRGWQSSVTKAHSLVDGVVNTGVTGSSQAKSTQKKIVSALDAASKASSDAAKSVKTLGAPNLKNGAKISSTISTAIGNTAKVFSDAKAAAAKAPTDPKKFQAKMKSISAQVDRDYSAAGKDVAGIDALDAGGQLDDAFNAEPACSFASAE